jgi:hypothetical protein
VVDSLPPYYRGVPPEHPAYPAALEGKVRVGNPNGTVTPEQHNFGNVGANSPWSSWTPFPHVAKGFAGDDGVILVRDRALPGWRGSPNKADPSEAEVLLHGNHDGVKVLKPGEL